MIDRDKKEDRETIPIKLTGKQLTILVTGLFLVSVLSFVFGALVMRGLNSQDHDEYFVSEDDRIKGGDDYSDNLVSLNEDGINDVEQKIASTSATSAYSPTVPLSDINQAEQKTPVNGLPAVEQSHIGSGASNIAEITDNKKPVKGPIISAAPVAEKVSVTSILESKKVPIDNLKQTEDAKMLEDERVVSQDKKRSGMYTVQIIAYREADRAKADKLRDELIKRGYDSYIEGVNIPNKGRYYRVRVGDYNSKEAAYHIVDSLSSKENAEMNFGKPMVVLK